MSGCATISANRDLPRSRIQPSHRPASPSHHISTQLRCRWAGYFHRARVGAADENGRRGVPPAQGCCSSDTPSEPRFASRRPFGRRSTFPGLGQKGREKSSNFLRDKEGQTAASSAWSGSITVARSQRPPGTSYDPPYFGHGRGGSADDRCVPISCASTCSKVRRQKIDPICVPCIANWVRQRGQATNGRRAPKSPAALEWL